MGDDCMDLPPGFRFHPTDEEIITHYLSKKVSDRRFNPKAMGEVDLNKCEPWDLPSKAKMGEKEWYFFCQKDRKYPTGMRTNRATEAGYWKATGKDKEIHKGKGVLVGMKKTLVFYKGRAPKGEKTNWVMHEFSLEGNSNLPKTSKDEWVVSRVFDKSTGVKRSPIVGLLGQNNSYEYLLNPPPCFINSKGLTSIEEGRNLTGISSSMTAMEDQHGLHNINTPNNHFYTQNQGNQPMFFSQIPRQNPLIFLPGSTNSGYLHHEQAMMRALAADNAASADFKGQCKIEQLISNCMVSPPQDMGLSTEKNIELSSFDDDDDPSSDGPVAGLENLWEY